jgi:AraC-like DNA-binding protein
MLCYEVALELGMEREDAATRWFKHRTGMTMEGFRRRNGISKNSRRGGGRMSRKCKPQR